MHKSQQGIVLYIDLHCKQKKERHTDTVTKQKRTRKIAQSAFHFTHVFVKSWQFNITDNSSSCVTKKITRNPERTEMGLSCDWLANSAILQVRGRSVILLLTDGREGRLPVNSKPFILCWRKAGASATTVLVTHLLDILLCLHLFGNVVLDEPPWAQAGGVVQLNLCLRGSGKLFWHENWWELQKSYFPGWQIQTSPNLWKKKPQKIPPCLLVLLFCYIFHLVQVKIHIKISFLMELR